MMRMMPFYPPTEDYDERLKVLDEKISALLAERHTISAGNPGFPRPEYLNDWAEKYHLPLRLLQTVFAMLHRPPDFRERVQPDQFLRFVPLMEVQQKNDILVMIPYMRQHNNSSVVTVVLEGSGLSEDFGYHLDINLSVDGYDTMAADGQSRQGYASHNFIVTPPIPDEEIPHLNMMVHFETRQLPRPVKEPPRPIPSTTVRFNRGDQKDPQ